MAQSGFLDVPNGRLFYTVEGDGPAILCLHAGIADHRMWDAQVAAFAPTHTVIRYDLRSYGQSTTEAGAPFDPRQDVLALLDHLGIERAALIGCSLGGGIAIDCAIGYPDRVSALIPVGSDVSGYPGKDFPDEMPTFKQMEALYMDGKYDQLADMEAKIFAVGFRRTLEAANRVVYDYVRSLSYERFTNPPAEGKREQPAMPAYDHLDQIAVPALVIYGDEDTSAILDIGKTLAQGIPGARLHVIPNAAHLPNMEYPDLFNRLVLDFLAGANA